MADWGDGAGLFEKQSLSGVSRLTDLRDSVGVAMRELELLEADNHRGGCDDEGPCEFVDLRPPWLAPGGKRLAQLILRNQKAPRVHLRLTLDGVACSRSAPCPAGRIDRNLARPVMLSMEVPVTDLMTNREAPQSNVGFEFGQVRLVEDHHPVRWTQGSQDPSVGLLRYRLPQQSEIETVQQLLDVESQAQMPSLPESGETPSLQ